MGSAICGGVISKTKFFGNPGAYMMCYYMPDKQYKKYVELKKKNRLGLDKKAGLEAERLFDKYAISAI